MGKKSEKSAVKQPKSSKNQIKTKFYNKIQFRVKNAFGSTPGTNILIGK